MSGLSKGKVCGAVTVGEKGQVVIPAGVRRSFKIKPGDKLIVFAKPDNIGLIPAEGLTHFLNETR
ncbi:MAG: AbrB/MazE/SpoVT family DNA-binding domain-containing protein [Candidatus Omnitrophota bacterium]